MTAMNGAANNSSVSDTSADGVQRWEGRRERGGRRKGEGGTFSSSHRP
jgi:hypothetical protein